MWWGEEGVPTIFWQHLFGQRGWVQVPEVQAAPKAFEARQK